MGWFSRKKQPEVEQRGVPLADTPAILQLLGVDVDTDGAAVSVRQSLTLSAVFRAVSLIAGSVATLPLRVWESDANGLRHEVRSFLDRPTGHYGMTQTEWLECIMVCLLLHGNAYLVRKQDGRGTNALFPVDPQAVMVEWDPSKPDGRKYTVRMADGRSEVLDCLRLVHIMGPSLDGLKGMSVVESARRSFATGIEGDRHAYRSFSSGASIAGLVTPQQDEELTEEEARQIKADFQRAIRGAENVGGVAVVNRHLEFSPWQMSAADAQFLESRTFSVEDVGRWFGVPPHLLGLQIQSSWGTGIAEQNRGLARYTLAPWLKRIQSRLALLFPPGKTVEFDLSEFIKPSPEEEMRLTIDMLNSGIYTLNEARAIVNLPPVGPDGDINRLPPGSLTPDQMKANEGVTDEAAVSGDAGGEQQPDN